MSNEKLVLTIAEAILANTRVLQSLVDTLPKATQVAIADQVVKATPVTPAAQVVAPVPVAPVVAAPAPIPTPVAPVIPVPMVVPPVAVAPPIPVVAVTPAAASPSNPPFVDQKGMIKYVMDTYKALGASRGADIQAVLTGIGTSNINEVKPEHYAALFAGIEALK
jgi:outer membrane biosynthesis protein TonB